jgi:hypothetical protein
MEVPMLKSRRRSLQFDSLEGKVLLSAGMADPAVTVHRHVSKAFTLNGSVHGLPTGSFVSQGLDVSSFLVSGQLGSMGKVGGTFLLSDRLVPHGKLPDLSNSLLILTDKKGSLLLGINPSHTNHYSFAIIGVTTGFISVTGTGSLAIAPNPHSDTLAITLHSARK